MAQLDIVPTCFDCGSLIVDGGQIQHEFWCDGPPKCTCERTTYCRHCVDGAVAAAAKGKASDRAARRRAARESSR